VELNQVKVRIPGKSFQLLGKQEPEYDMDMHLH